MKRLVTLIPKKTMKTKSEWLSWWSTFREKPPLEWHRPELFGDDDWFRLKALERLVATKDPALPGVLTETLSSFKKGSYRRSGFRAVAGPS